MYSLVARPVCVPGPVTCRVFAGSSTCLCTRACDVSCIPRVLNLSVYPGLWCILYLQGAHVSINARTEDDVDEKLVISKVAKASGANYSFHKEKKQAIPAAEPVVCNLTFQ